MGDAYQVLAHIFCTVVNSTIGIHRVVAGADHMALALDHEHSQATITAIGQVVVAVRSGVAPQ
jgi:hypothetical protein